MKRSNSKSPRSREAWRLIIQFQNSHYLQPSSYPSGPPFQILLAFSGSFTSELILFRGNGEFHNLFLAIAKSRWNIRPLFSRNDYNACNFTRDVAKSFLKHSRRNIPRAKYLFCLSSDILWEMLPLPWEPPRNRIFLAEKLAFSPRFPNPARKVFADCVFEWMLKQKARGERDSLQDVLLVQAFRKIRL